MPVKDIMVSFLQSIHHTSLTHALLYGSTAPVLIAMGTLLMRKPISAGKLSLLCGCAIKVCSWLYLAIMTGKLCRSSLCCSQVLTAVGEILGTFLGLVGVVLLTRANKVDQQVLSWLHCMQTANAHGH